MTLCANSPGVLLAQWLELHGGITEIEGLILPIPFLVFSCSFIHFAKQLSHYHFINECIHRCSIVPCVYFKVLYLAVNKPFSSMKCKSWSAALAPEVSSVSSNSTPVAGSIFTSFDHWLVRLVILKERYKVMKNSNSSYSLTHGKSRDR